MICKNCGNENVNGNAFCVVCGSKLEEPVAPVQEPVNPQAAYQAAPVYQAPVYNPQPTYYAAPQVPEASKPLSPWAYLGYNILFNLPFIGFIMLIVFSLNNDNIHRRNYARSYWCALLLAVIAIVLSIIFLSSSGAFTALEDLFYSLT